MYYKNKKTVQATRIERNKFIHFAYIIEFIY